MFAAHLNFFSFYVFALTFLAQFQSIHRLIHVPSRCIHPPTPYAKILNLFILVWIHITLITCLLPIIKSSSGCQMTVFGLRFYMPQPWPLHMYFTHANKSDRLYKCAFFLSYNLIQKCKACFTSYSSLSRASSFLFNSFRCCEKAATRTGVE